jgi:hypothetical protein
VLRWTSPDWIWPRLWNFPLYGNPYVVSYSKFSSLVSSKYMLACCLMFRKVMAIFLQTFTCSLFKTVFWWYPAVKMSYGNHLVPPL